MKTEFCELIRNGKRHMHSRRPVAVIVMPDGSEQRLMAEEVSRNYSNLVVMHKVLKKKFGTSRLRYSLTTYGAAKFSVS